MRASGSIRWWLAAAVAAVVTAPGTAPVRAHAAGVELAGTTTIRGDSSGTAYVHVSAPATMTYGPDGSSPDVAFAGNGRVVGLELLKTDGSFGITTYQLNGCDAADCTPRPFTMLAGSVPYYVRGFGGGTSGGATFTPGDYVLTYVADGSGDSIVLTLHGLGGATTIGPTAPANVVVTTIQPTLSAWNPGTPAGGGPLVESGGFDLAVTQPLGGFAVASVILYGGPGGPLIADRGGCLYTGTPPADAYLPECPGAADTSAGESDNLVAAQDWSSPSAAGSAYAAGFRAGAGTYGLGAFAVAGTNVASSSWVGFAVQPAIGTPQALPASGQPIYNANGVWIGTGSYTLNGVYAGPVTIGRLHGDIDGSLVPHVGAAGRLRTF